MMKLLFSFLFSLLLLTCCFSNDLRPNTYSIIQLELSVNDNKEANVYVLKVEFDGKDIRLLPADITGNRGKTYLKLPPGNYTLKWWTSTNELNAYQTFSQTITLRPTDYWFSIQIFGQEFQSD